MPRSLLKVMKECPLKKLRMLLRLLKATKVLRVYLMDRPKKKKKKKNNKKNRLVRISITQANLLRKHSLEIVKISIHLLKSRMPNMSKIQTAKVKVWKKHLLGKKSQQTPIKRRDNHLVKNSITSQAIKARRKKKSRGWTYPLKS